MSIDDAMCGTGIRASLSRTTDEVVATDSDWDTVAKVRDTDVRRHTVDDERTAMAAMTDDADTAAMIDDEAIDLDAATIVADMVELMSGEATTTVVRTDEEATTTVVRTDEEATTTVVRSDEEAVTTIVDMNVAAAMRWATNEVMKKSNASSLLKSHDRNAGAANFPNRPNARHRRRHRHRNRSKSFARRNPAARQNRDTSNAAT